MKLITCLILVWSSTAYAVEPVETAKWKSYPEAEVLAQEGFIFAALDAQIRKLAAQSEKDSSDLEMLEDLVLKTNVEALEDYDRQVLTGIPVATVHFLLGREAWAQKKTTEARSWLLSVPRWHRYYPEARLLLADMADPSDVLALEQQCIESARKRADEVKSMLLKRYYTVLAEDCMTLAPRKHYKNGEYAEAMTGLSGISKRSYKWPSLLLEKAWAAYNLKDYNRSLGLLVTYKSPLLSSYFYPEAEVLTALSYFRLCLYDDALLVIDQYYTHYKPGSEALESLLKSQRDSSDYFYKLMNLSPAEKAKVHPFVAQLAVQISHRPRYALDQASLKRVEVEISRMKTTVEGQPKDVQKWMKASMKQLEAVRTNLIGRINYHAKKDMFAFVSEVYMLSEEMFKVKLEIIARKKDLVYGQKDLIANRGRGNFKQVKKTRFEQFWKFQGAFWADELGDYSFGLPSNCETVRKTEEAAQ